MSMSRSVVMAAAAMAAGIAVAAGAKPLNAMHTAISSFTSPNSSVVARDFFNAPIEFDFPYLGNFGSCNIQTHSNGWTRVNIDRWEFAPCDSFSNGVATVVVNGQTNTWTILAPDKPLYRFGRYYCGFVREDRLDGSCAIYAALFFDGVMIGAEHLREDFRWQSHTWKELADIPDGISQIGGGEWETGFIVWPGCGTTPIDINQMIIRHGQPYVLSVKRRRWLKTATEEDIQDEWNRTKTIIAAIKNMPSECNSDEACQMSAILNLKDQFWQTMLQWKILNAKSYKDKYDVLGAKSAVEQIQQRCNAARSGTRGSHAWPDWGECLKMDLLDAWVLRGEDACCWRKVANMKGVIDGHDLEFKCGFAVMDVPVKRDEYGNANEPIVLYKVQNDYYEERGFVYAKVIGDGPGYCYMPCSYTPPTYVVKVDKLGKIVRWYPYPKRAKTLKEFLGASSRSSVRHFCH